MKEKKGITYESHIAKGERKVKAYIDKTHQSFDSVLISLGICTGKGFIVHKFISFFISTSVDKSNFVLVFLRSLFLGLARPPSTQKENILKHPHSPQKNGNVTSFYFLKWAQMLQCTSRTVV